MYDKPIIIKFRNFGRKLKVNKLITSLLPKKDYEYLFEKALLKNVTESDIVYDVGANRGFYTKKLLDKVKMGKVFCFEPVPESNKIIRDNLGNRDNLFIHELALGSKEVFIK